MARTSHSRWVMLARSLASAVGASVSGGCLLADPPEPPPPEQTAPVLDLVRANPPITKVLTIPPDSLPVTFSIPFRSNDLGDQVVAVPFLDFDLPSLDADAGATLVRAGDVRFRLPSTIEDREREPFQLSWAPRPENAGCHNFTVLVTHLSNFVRFDTKLPFDSEDIAIATWWLNIENDNSDTDPALMADCPGG